MIFTCMQECVEFLEKQGELIRIETELDPDLEMAAVHNRVFEAGGPAILFERVKGSAFPAVSNIFGTYERALKILEPELSKVSTLVDLVSDPSVAFKSPLKSLKSLTSLARALPLKKRVSLGKSIESGSKDSSVLDCRCKITDLPMIRCWPEDGGGFIFLPQVFSIDPDYVDSSGSASYASMMHSNLGMYRIQLSGGDYIPDREVGLHYQIHRGIGNHHAKALEKNLPLPVSIFVGGPPAHTLAAIMPLPEGLPEIAFAGALAGRSFRYALMPSQSSSHLNSVVSLDADFCITGRIMPCKTKPEGPFGDHLGYYSLIHEFPYIEVDAVYHRKNAIWPFTVVGRPPREDSVFGRIIHEITASAIPHTLPGVTAIHAVDVAGVHPLLLARAVDRYTPFDNKKPRELLTHANSILGTGQLSLAKYLVISSHNDNPELDISDEMGFFMHILERIDFTRDIHFQTCTTMDTLDYSAEGINEGSKVVMVAAGPKRRELLRYFPSQISIPYPFSQPRLAAPGIVVVKGTEFKSYQEAQKEIDILAISLKSQKTGEFRSQGLTESSNRTGNRSKTENRGKTGNRDRIEGLPLFVVVDDSFEASRNFATFLWITFSRSNPSHDIYGSGHFTSFKHWGCTGPLIIDARIKPFHAPPLLKDPAIEKKIDDMARKGGPLYGVF
ncbi:MAG: UbiD family decarboxylase [Desulfamplus sp.]|nr:UbiD family decarboxylase [Desulfamplus sp.]